MRKICEWREIKWVNEGVDWSRNGVSGRVEGHEGRGIEKEEGDRSIRQREIVRYKHLSKPLPRR